jgi:hypothetical protein
MEAVAVVKPEESLTLQKVGAGLFKSGLFPNAKNEYGAFAIVEYGRELGIGPMMALKNINIISGQVACNAQLMLSLALAKGVTYSVVKEGQDGATIVFKRGEMEYKAIFDKHDAEAAGLLSKDNWKKYPADMYFWRAVAKGIRRVAPDAILGLYTADEISEGQFKDVIDIPVEAQGEPEKFLSEEEVEQPRNEPKKDGASKKQIDYISLVLQKKASDQDELLFVNDILKLIGTNDELESLMDLTKDQARKVFDYFELQKWTKPREKK